jgi:hypothetical protein
MENRQDLYALLPEPVRDDVSRAGDDEFTGAGYAAWSAKVWQLGQALDCIQQSDGDPIGGLRMVLGDVRPQVCQVPDRAGRPDDDHARGAFRSRFRPHERSQPATFSCGTPRPSSISAMPAWISSSCQLSASTNVAIASAARWDFGRRARFARASSRFFVVVSMRMESVVVMAWMTV